MQSRGLGSVVSGMRGRGCRAGHAATLLDLGRYCDGLAHDHLAEHHQGTADVLNAVATSYRRALAA